MIIGVPKESKADEYRVSLPPDKVALLTRLGHSVVVEAGAGAGAGFPDEEYLGAKATILNDARRIYEQAKMIVKVKEPQPSEFGYYCSEHILFCYLHLAPNPILANALLSAKVTSIAYETVQEEGKHGLPLLYPMSEIAGKLAPQIGSRLLQSQFGGNGKLLSGVPGTLPCNVIVVGGGTVGFNAARVARSMGADVTVVDLDLGRLRFIDEIWGGAIKTRFSTPVALLELLPMADIVVGAVLVPGAVTPRVITREMIASMAEKSVALDVSIDQGGAIEGIRATTATNPGYVENGVIHSAIPNIPGMVAHTASVSLSNSIYPYVAKLADLGLDAAIKVDQAMALGVNTLRGQVTHSVVAGALGLENVPVHEAIVP